MDDKQISIKSALLIALGIFIAVFIALFPLTAPGIFWGDHPELATAAATLGVPHGPGYPVYSLLSHLSVHALPASAARAANLFSLFCAGLAAGLAALVVIIILGRLAIKRALIIYSAIIVGLAFAANLDEISQSLVSEVYTLNSALIWLLILIVCLYVNGNDARWAYLWAFLTALATGNHLQGGLIAPGLLLVILWFKKATHVKVVHLGLAFLLGMGVYLFMPLRSSAHALLDWGVTAKVENFIWTVSNQGFMEGKFTFPLEQILRTTEMLGELFWIAMGPVSLLFALIGIFWGWRLREWRLLWLAILISLVLSAVFLVNNIAPMFEWTVFAIPTVAMVLMLAIFGMGVFLKLIRRWQTGWQLIIVCILLSSLAIWPILRFGLAFDLFDRATATATEQLAKAKLDSLPPNSVVINMSSADYFAQEHLQAVMGIRPDVAQAFGMLLQFEWAREQFRQRSPGFSTPAGFGYHIILDYCLVPQPSRPLFFQPSEPMMDRYLAIHLVPWGMLYKVKPYLSFEIMAYLSCHERLIRQQDKILSGQRDFFSDAVGQTDAEARTAYYYYLAHAASLATAYLYASGTQASILQSKLQAQDPPLAMEILKRLSDYAEIAVWETLMKKLGDKERMRLEYYRDQLARKVNRG